MFLFFNFHIQKIHFTSNRNFSFLKEEKKKNSLKAFLIKIYISKRFQCWDAVPLSVIFHSSLSLPTPLSLFLQQNNLICPRFHSSKRCRPLKYKVPFAVNLFLERASESCKMRLRDDIM